MNARSALSLLSISLFTMACSGSDDAAVCHARLTTFTIQAAPAQAGSAPVAVAELQDDALALQFSPSYARSSLLGFAQHASGDFDLVADFADFVPAGAGATFRLVVTGGADGPNVLAVKQGAAGLEMSLTSGDFATDQSEAISVPAGRFFVKRTGDVLALGVRVGNSTLTTTAQVQGQALDLVTEIANDGPAELPDATSVRLLSWTATGGGLVSDDLECK
jgi:hypothetical protein